MCSVSNMLAMAEQTNKYAEFYRTIFRKNQNEQAGEQNVYNSKCKEKEYIKILDEKIYDELKTIDEIALSKSGRVLEVSYNNEIYALKIMNHKRNSPNCFSDIQHFFKEYEFLNNLHHPNILKTNGFFFGKESKPPALLLEFCQMDLDQLMKSKELSKFEIVSITYQIIEAMKYIHFKKIVHLNLKPSNILIKNDGTVKVSDFRIAQSTQKDAQMESHEIGAVIVNLEIRNFHNTQK